MKISLLFLLICIGCNTGRAYPEGGYNYPKNYLSEDTNLYYYPIKDIESKKDAFGDYYKYHFFQLFNEPNLSLKPVKKEIFRLNFADAFQDIMSLTLSDNAIIVKNGNTDGLYTTGINQLNSIEQMHLKMLNQYYPLEEMDKNLDDKRFCDSMIKIYPQLLDVNYYHSIYKKSYIRTNKKFAYDTKSFSITPQKYDSLVNQLNASGFWTLSPNIKAKKNMFDGFSFTLEANTRKKYQIVSVEGCSDHVIKFTEFCQALINLTHLGKEINLICGEK